MLVNQNEIVVHQKIALFDPYINHNKTKNDIISPLLQYYKYSVAQYKWKNVESFLMRYIISQSK